MFISTIVKLRYRFWKEPYRTTRISTVANWDYGSRENQYRATRFSTIAKWEIWFRENHGDFTDSSLHFNWRALLQEIVELVSPQTKMITFVNKKIVKMHSGILYWTWNYYFLNSNCKFVCTCHWSMKIMWYMYCVPIGLPVYPIQPGRA